jgi:methyl-accepting chemotaxis protein
MSAISDFDPAWPNPARSPQAADTAGVADPDSDRLRQTLQRHDVQGEKAIAVAQAGISCFVLILHVVAQLSSEAQAFDLWVVIALGGLIASSAIRFLLCRANRLPDRLLDLLNLADIAIFLSLIWSYQFAYHHPAGGVLKAPSYVLLFVLVALRALRFHPRPILVAGTSAAVGWGAMVLLALAKDGAGAITRSYTEYLTSYDIMIGAEVERVVGLVALTLFLALAAHGARRILSKAAHATDYAEALEAARHNLEEATTAKEQARERARQYERALRVEELIKNFERGIGETLGGVGGAVGKLEDVSGALEANANYVTECASLAGAAAGNACEEVESAAGAAEELAQSINRIATEAAKSTQVADRAVAEARKTNTAVHGLSQAAARIGEVAVLIQGIAEQTNLLALNATIEAARAGEAGRGFAVVANEVKALATQTAKATDEITLQIKEIQSTSEATAEAITAVDGIIDEMSRIAALVASAVEEQNIVIGGITENVSRAATGSRRGVENMSEVDRAADDTGATAEQVKALARSLSEQADRLRANVDRFLSEVRVA